MNLGIMQPYFFPYLGYYDLINRTDRWVVFDVVQYKPKSWMNRNRILDPKGGFQYVTVPVERHVGSGSIRDVRVADAPESLQRILGQIQHYRKARAPFFTPVRDLIRGAFERGGSGRLVDLNVASLDLVCSYIGIPFRAMVLSESGMELPAIDRPGQWAVEISSALGATEYINPPGGREIFDESEFARRGIRLRFTELVDFRYETGPYAFVELLSIIDVLMWNSPEAVHAYLDRLKESRPTLPI
jgi:hypothetical protein